MNIPTLVLASSSPYRRALLSKLHLNVNCYTPNIDESPLAGESPHDVVKRLSIEKARSAQIIYPDALIIGSDQICVINDTILGKPGNADNAIAQLTAASGQRVTFYTSLTVLNSKTAHIQSDVELFHVYFRDLTENEIRNYVEIEKPFHCAGSFKCEGLGIALFTQLEGRDPNTLVGLPLILLNDMLRVEGIDLFNCIINQPNAATKTQ